MDRRKAKAAKRIVFEPKVPEQKAQDPGESGAKGSEPGVETGSEPHPGQDAPLRGLFAPMSFAAEQSFDLHSDGVILCLPPALTRATLVVFSDGTLALRQDGVLYACDSSFLGDAMTVEITDKIKKTGDIRFVVTGYEMPIDQ